MNQNLRLTILTFISVSFLFGSCSKTHIISTGARDNRPLIFNNEYELSELKEIEVEGRSIFGIPSFAKNNKNKNTSGFLFYFNGVQLGHTPRIMPILTLVGLSAIGGCFIASVEDRGREYTANDFTRAWYGGDYETFIPGAILTLPITGAINNMLWKNSASSGISRTLKYRLVNENPEIDIFYFPKYEVSKKNVFSSSDVTGGKPEVKLRYLWIQDVNVKARVKGAKIKL
ncbi:MAG: hypothetical protein ACOYLH_11595 [Flavobacteriales bacterium]|jgi:hypothetical protein